jgi:tyrosine aminotransferase
MQWTRCSFSTFFFLFFMCSVHGSLREVEAGAKRLATVILGASHLAQTAVPALLDLSDTMVQQWRAELRDKLGHHAMFLCQKLAECHGLSVNIPGGAMYALCHSPTQMDEDRE